MNSICAPRTARRSLYFIVLCIFTCTGCLCPPVKETPPVYSLRESWQNSIPSTLPSELTIAADHWWEVFDDQKLNAIVLEGLNNSPSLDQALARFDQATCLSKVARSDQMPQLSLNGDGERVRIAKDLRTSTLLPTGEVITPTIPSPTPIANNVGPLFDTSPFVSTQPIIVPATQKMKTVKSPTFVNDLIANFLVTYEIDFWGKFYLKTQAALRRAEEAEDDLATSRLLLVQQIAATYFTIQAMEYELSLIRDELFIHKERVGLLSKQCNTGLTNTFQLLDEGATLETKKINEQFLLQARDLNYSLLAVLVGREPNYASFDISKASWSFPIVPTGLPSSLLVKRPDIKARIKEVEAIIAEIGAAKAELLPSISLSAAAGYEAGVAHEWFKWKNRIWEIGSSIAQPIFDGGRRFAEIDVTKARFHEVTAFLTQTVLTAVKEVEDALVAIRTQTERRNAAIRREKDLVNTNLLRSDLCTCGVQDYLIVLQAKENLLQARRDRIHEEYNLQLGTLSLMKSLGGSWENNEEM